MNEVVKTVPALHESLEVSGLFLHKVTRWHHSLYRVVVIMKKPHKKGKLPNLLRMHNVPSPTNVKHFTVQLAEMFVIFSVLGNGLLCLGIDKRHLSVVLHVEMRSFYLSCVLMFFILKTSVS
jgi:hypothetical protein